MDHQVDQRHDRQLAVALHVEHFKYQALYLVLSVFSLLQDSLLSLELVLKLDHLILV